MDIYKKMQKKAATHKKLYHYTTIEAVEKILSSKSFLLSNLNSESLNDKHENERIRSINKNKIFVCCFTHESNENIKMWSEYTRSNVHNGIRIELDSKVLQNYKIKSFSNPDYYFEEKDVSQIHRNYDSEKLWAIKHVVLADVYYAKDVDKFNHLDHDLATLFKGFVSKERFFNEKYPGLIKHYKWYEEKETRFRVRMAPIGLEGEINGSSIKPPFSNLLLEIPIESNNFIKLRLNPYASQGLKNKLKELLNRLKLKLDIENSEL